jgi:hypothetical protein
VLAALALTAAMIQPSNATQAAIAGMLGDLAAGLEAPPDPIELRVEAAREAGKNKDILAWGKAVMPEKFYKPFCMELHGYFTSIRHAELTSTVAPRGYAKTLVKCKLITMFQALEEPDLFDFYLNVQATHDKGVNLNFSIKHEFENNKVIRALYGNQVGTVKWTDEIFMLPSGVIFRGAGVGDSIRGMMFLDRRPKYTIVDDLYDKEDIDNPERIQAKNDWYWGDLYPGREKGKQTSFHTQGTVAGENDLMLQLGEMAKTDPAIKHREFAAIKPDGEPLWVELNSAADLEKERQRMGDAIFERENQGNRSSRATSIIKPHMIAGWRQPASSFRCDAASDPYTLLDVVVGVDPSVGKKQNQNAIKQNKPGDPAAYARIWKLQPKNLPGALPVYFIEAVINQRLGMQERIDAAKDMVTTARPDRRVRRMRVETIAGFDDIGTLIARAVGVPCEKVPSVPDKMLNLEKHQPHFQNGRVFINENIDQTMLREIEGQLTKNNPSHDDIRDAIFLAIDDAGPGMKSWV